MTKGGYVITMKNGKVKEDFGSAAKRRLFQREDRRCHRSEYRKPEKQAKLVKPVSKRIAEKNMEAMLHTLAVA
jgi:hypothetical protein